MTPIFKTRVLLIKRKSSKNVSIDGPKKNTYDSFDSLKFITKIGIKSLRKWAIRIASNVFKSTKIPTRKRKAPGLVKKSNS